MFSPVNRRDSCSVIYAETKSLIVTYFRQLTDTNVKHFDLTNRVIAKLLLGKTQHKHDDEGLYYYIHVDQHTLMG